MIRFVRTATANSGKIGLLVQWGREITEYLNSNHGSNITFFVERFGRQRVHWSMDVDSLADLDTFLKKAQGDENYMKRISEVGDIIMSGSTHDTVVESA